MYLGHSFFAFAVVAAGGYVLDLDRRRVLVLAGLAAGYGLLPDIDVWRTGYVFLREGSDGVFPTEQHVWKHSWVVHRALTHSVVTGAVAAAVSGLTVRATGRDSTGTRLGAALGVATASAGLLAVAAASAGRPGVVTMGLFLGGAVGLAALGRRQGATAEDVAAVAGVGLLTHPFGDLWMGRPPALLAPVVSEPPLGEVMLSPDPVLHFVFAVAVEVALLGACLHLVCALYDRRTLDYLSPLALAGLGYAAVLGRVPDPTFAEAYQFTTGLFVVAMAVALAVLRTDPRHQRVRARAFGSGVAAFGAGLVGYAAAYALA
jgi:hypothetical protein